MNFTGKLEGLKMDYATRKQSISVEVNEDARDAFQELKDCEKLDIQIKKHREKRNLDANAYYWVLITKFAKKLELSNPEAHNMCLIRYGYPVILSGKSAFTTIPDTEEAENKVKNSTEYHLQPTSQVREGVDGVMYRTYRLLRGSRTYNTEEMSRLISGLITMCKEAQIPDREIATPEEKGKKGERELAAILKSYGYEDSRRGQQYCGSNGDADVVGLPGIHIECKRVEKLNIYDAVEQSKNDARTGEMPVVMHRKNRKEWLVTMPLDDWMKLYER